MWWPESNLTLHLSKSAYYQRVLVCIYVFSHLVLWQSGLGLSLQMSGSWFLFYHMAINLRQAIPTGQPIQLIYMGKDWVLLTSQQSYKLDEVRLLLHAGVFILLRVSGANIRQIYVIFFDQLTKSQWRRLMWLC